jgi:hypothetical protein
VIDTPRLSPAPVAAARGAASGRRLIFGLGLGGAAAAVLLVAPGAAPALSAVVMGGAPAMDYDQAVGRTRTAATAVLERSGSQSCLRGKLTNALLTMVASCEAAGERNGLCELSNRAVVQPTWSFPFMEATARELLELINARTTP